MISDIDLASNERLCNVGDRLRLIQRRNGLQWGSDAYLLAAYIRKSGLRACELGCGTGVISLLCASMNKFSEIYAVEIQPIYAELAKRNAALNDLDAVFHPVCEDIRDSRPELLGGRFDVVFSNPPYMPPNSGHTSLERETLIAKHEIYGGIFDFCAAAARLLNYGGIFYCVFPPKRLPELFAALRQYSLEPKKMLEIYPDVSSRPSAVIVESKLGAAPSLEVLPPLIMYNEDFDCNGTRTMTKKAARIYQKCSFAE